jgi:hypothetical protein
MALSPSSNVSAPQTLTEGTASLIPQRKDNCAASCAEEELPDIDP